jgi:hypothetical protein
MSYQLEQEIKNCLQFFGPLDIRSIQAKLDQRSLVVSQNAIIDACEAMVNRKEIREATGFEDFAYKI